MRIIHCADLHLDSKMETHLPYELASKRRLELLKTFEKMIDWAKNNDVSAVLIAGDLFDKKSVSLTAKNVVRDVISLNPEIEFYYLRGNHDVVSVFDEQNKPKNLHTFGDEWVGYNLGKVMIYGCEKSSKALADNLMTDTDMVNIVMLHGQIKQTHTQDTQIIGLNDYANKGINYLALGHIHEYTCERLDGRGLYCYSGCLEGRGFDECGDRGFVVIDIDENTKTLDNYFYPFASRKLYRVSVDVAEITNNAGIIDAVKRALDEKQIESINMVEIKLIGDRNVDFDDIVTEIIEDFFRWDYYFVSVNDKTTNYVDYLSYKNDKSLKGEFIRLVFMDNSLSTDEKGTVIRYGLKALAGEAIE